MVRVLLVDDQPEFLELGRMLLSHHEDIDVVGETTSGEEALALAASLEPDVVILDVQMPGLNGFETARRLLEAAPGLGIILTSAFEDPQYESLSRAVGALGFVSKAQFSAERIIGLL